MVPQLIQKIILFFKLSFLKKHIAIFGSTGSIGTQALEVVDAYPDSFKVEVLTAHNNDKLLIEQAIKYKPNAVVIGNEDKYAEVFNKLDRHLIKVYAGEEAYTQVMSMNSIDLVLMAIVGFAGLKPVISAIEQKKRLALANKESLVIAGHIISEMAIRNQVQIIPVDSELSAIFQCLVGEYSNPIEKIILTASGGPFRGFDIEQLKQVTVNDALEHPNWDMGDKVTVDSATLMNKGFEAIESRWLFGLSPDQIEVVVHPQSIIHSMVHFTDGSVKSLMSNTDMRIPIQYAFTYPDRLPGHLDTLDLIKVRSLSFEEPDVKNFRNLALAFKALERGGNSPCTLNAANELGVQAFLQGRIKFLHISALVEDCLDKIQFINEPDLDDLLKTDLDTRQKANEFINALH